MLKKSKQYGQDLLGCQRCSKTYISQAQKKRLTSKTQLVIVACQLPIYSEITVRTHLSFTGQCNFFLWHTTVCLELMVAVTLWSLYCCLFNWALKKHPSIIPPARLYKTAAHSMIASQCSSWQVRSSLFQKFQFTNPGWQEKHINVTNVTQPVGLCEGDQVIKLTAHLKNKHCWLTDQ